MVAATPVTAPRDLLTHHATTGAVFFRVKITAGAKKDGFLSVLSDGTLKIGIAAPPEKGKANAKLVAFLANFFGVHREQVEILAGHNQQVKFISIS